MSSRGLVIRNDRSDSIDVPSIPLSPNIIVTNYFNASGVNGQKEISEGMNFSRKKCV